MRDLFYQRWLLVFQRGMAIQTDPNVLILLPIGLEERIVIGTGVNTGLPFVIDFTVTLPAGLGFETRQPLRHSLKGNCMGIVRTQSEDHDGLDLGVIQIGRAEQHESSKAKFQRELHASSRAWMCRWTDADNAVRLYPPSSDERMRPFAWRFAI